MRPLTVAIAMLLALTGAGPAASQEAADVVFDDGQTHVLAGGSPLHGSETTVVIRDGTTVILDGIHLGGTVHVADGGVLRVASPSEAHTLRVTGDGHAGAEGELTVVRVVAEDDAVVDGDRLAIVLPPMPELETQEEWDEWFAWREAQPPYLVARDRARVRFDTGQDDRLGIDSVVEHEASVEMTGFGAWILLDMRDDATFTSATAYVDADVWDRSRLEVTESVAWGGLRLHDDASAHVRGFGGATTGFYLRLEDRAGARAEGGLGGYLGHYGSGLLEVVDTVPPDLSNGQQELRVGLHSEDARVVLRNFGGPNSLNPPSCGQPCNPWYLVIGSGEYLRAEDSLFHLEADGVRFLELQESVAYSRGPQHRPVVRGECLLNGGMSAPVGYAYEAQCGRLGVTVLGGDGQPLPGAKVTLLEAAGEPVPVYDVADGEVRQDRITGDDGRAVLDFVTRGVPYSVRVESPGMDVTRQVIVLRDHEEITIGGPPSEAPAGTG